MEPTLPHVNALLLCEGYEAAERGPVLTHVVGGVQLDTNRTFPARLKGLFLYWDVTNLRGDVYFNAEVYRESDPANPIGVTSPLLGLEGIDEPAHREWGAIPLPIMITEFGTITIRLLANGRPCHYLNFDVTRIGE